MIEVLVGISGSGKSTYAKDKWEKDPKGTAIVNRDSIRNMLFAYTDTTISEYYQRPDLNQREKEVTKYETLLIKEGLHDNKLVIVDATHLKKSYLQRFEYFNVPINYTYFDISLVEAVDRCTRRDRKVEAHIIVRQYVQYLALQREGVPSIFTPKEPVQGLANKPTCIVFDIDGTLSHHRNRRSPFEWDKVGQDDFDESVTYLYDTHSSIDTPIIVCSGRDAVCEEQTKNWFAKHRIDEPVEWHFRKQGDMRPDWVVKEEMWRDIASRYTIMYLVDDREAVVQRARSLGLKVFQVEYNNF